MTEKEKARLLELSQELWGRAALKEYKQEFDEAYAYRKAARRLDEVLKELVDGTNLLSDDGKPSGSLGSSKDPVPSEH